MHCHGWKYKDKTAKHWPRSIDWKRHERQKECPQGVVIGSNSNFRQRVQSNSSLRSGFPRLLLIILPSILSKFRKETRRGLLHITRTLSMNNKRYMLYQIGEKIIMWPIYSQLSINQTLYSTSPPLSES